MLGTGAASSGRELLEVLGLVLGPACGICQVPRVAVPCCDSSLRAATAGGGPGVRSVRSKALAFWAIEAARFGCRLAGLSPGESSCSTSG